MSKTLCTLILDYAGQGSLYLVKPLYLEAGKRTATSALLGSAPCKFTLSGMAGNAQPIYKLSMISKGTVPDSGMIKDHLHQLAHNGWQVFKRTGFLEMDSYQRGFISKLLVKAAKYELPPSLKFDDSNVPESCYE